MITTYTKVCPQCRQSLPSSAFSWSAKAPDGCQSRCKECDNKSKLEWRTANPSEHRKRIRRSNFKKRGVDVHGIDKWFAEQLERQGGLCGMKDCDRKVSLAGDTLCIDHDHTTLKLRGILCRECNLALDWYEKNKHRHSVFEAYLDDY